MPDNEIIPTIFQMMIIVHNIPDDAQSNNIPDDY